MSAATDANARVFIDLSPEETGVLLRCLPGDTIELGFSLTLPDVDVPPNALADGWREVARSIGAFVGIADAVATRRLAIRDEPLLAHLAKERRWQGEAIDDDIKHGGSVEDDDNVKAAQEIEVLTGILDRARDYLAELAPAAGAAS